MTAGITYVIVKLPTYLRWWWGYSMSPGWASDCGLGRGYPYAPALTEI